MQKFSLDNAKYPRVHAVDRYMAKGLDMIITVIIALVFSVISYYLGALLAVLYAFLHDSIKDGVSPGKMIIGLKTIRYPNEELKMDWRASTKRNFSFGLFTIFAVIPMMGWILMFLVGIPLLVFEAYLIYNMESGYRLGDILAGTRVVSVRELNREREAGEPEDNE